MKRIFVPAVTALVILVLALSTLSSKSKSSANNIVPGVSTFAGLDGISYLIAVTQMKAVLLQLEANVRRNAEILASVKLLAAELKKLDCKCEEGRKR